jgi:NTP pyrophosphatase (non-canonical NTP hydrolase)
MMDLNDYIDEMERDSNRWFDYEDGEHQLRTFVLGLCGESGEVADLLKKYIRGSKTFDEMKDLMEVELIDVFHYWCLLIGLLGVDVEVVYRKKRKVNVARFG